MGANWIFTASAFLAFLVIGRIGALYMERDVAPFFVCAYIIGDDRVGGIIRENMRVVDGMAPVYTEIPYDGSRIGFCGIRDSITEKIKTCFEDKVTSGVLLDILCAHFDAMDISQYSTVVVRDSQWVFSAVPTKGGPSPPVYNNALEIDVVSIRHAMIEETLQSSTIPWRMLWSTVHPWLLWSVTLEFAFVATIFAIGVRSMFTLASEKKIAPKVDHQD